MQHPYFNATPLHRSQGGAREAFPPPPFFLPEKGEQPTISLPDLSTFTVRLGIVCDC